MAFLEYRTAGESHGQALIVLIEGLPSGLTVDFDLVNGEMRRRQGGYGRGGRMKIEQDKVNILSGIRSGVTIGSPMAVEVTNEDWRIDTAPEVHHPRPGHADLAGSLKWLTTDCRSTLERASARETAARVAAGAISKCLLQSFGVEVVGFVRAIGPVKANIDPSPTPDELRTQRDANEAYCPDGAAADKMIEAIRQAKVDKDTLGGIVEVHVHGLPPGVGSCFRWQDKLDARIAGAMVSIQAFKGVEMGDGFALAEKPGSQVHDAIYYDSRMRGSRNLGFTRKTNRLGGFEGGMSNGQPLIVRGVMKPIATLLMGMDSVNLKTKAPQRSDYERSDVCAVPAASVVAENVVAFEVARAFCEKFGADTMNEMRAAYDFYMEAARNL
ncbi:MAG: chorismate synthase [Planctomycetes bacterium]|nr:chorismate synthase [Planctomycetota bacterium]